ncbi:sigma-70 family RNA polymerase sigma factor family protein [Kribbella swartbergensis]
MDGYDEVTPRADPGQRRLISHCYRMLGSITEAQEVAARSDSLAGATVACLSRPDFRPLPTDFRPLPTDVAAPSDDPEGKLHQRLEVLWLEPIPDDLADDRPIGLDYIAGLQRLPAPERAAVILRDLEGWSADRITDLVGPVSHVHLSPPPLAPPDPALLARYQQAFEQYDVAAITGFFTDDTIWEMPPFTSWFRGARNIGRLISTHCPAKGPGDQLLVPLKANGQPAFAVYMRDPADNLHRAFQLQVLTLTATGIIHAVAFFDLTLFETFNLPDLLTTLPKNPYEPQPTVHMTRAGKHHQ